MAYQVVLVSKRRAGAMTIEVSEFTGPTLSIETTVGEIRVSCSADHLRALRNVIGLALDDLEDECGECGDGIVGGVAHVDCDHPEQGVVGHADGYVPSSHVLLA